MKKAGVIFLYVMNILFLFVLLFGPANNNPALRNIYPNINFSKLGVALGSILPYFIFSIPLSVKGTYYLV
jgi:hypothetical protein